jgi:large subunit ribosomal protein L17
MVTSFFDCEKITTTDARAKELRKMAEKLITMARRGDLHSRRLIMQVVRDTKTTAKLVDTIAPRYADRPGGYTRIIKLGHRAGDNAALSMIELVEEEVKRLLRKHLLRKKKQRSRSAEYKNQIEKGEMLASRPFLFRSAGLIPTRAACLS